MPIATIHVLLYSSLALMDSNDVEVGPSRLEAYFLLGLAAAGSVESGCVAPLRVTGGTVACMCALSRDRESARWRWQREWRGRSTPLRECDLSRWEHECSMSVMVSSAFARAVMYVCAVAGGAMLTSLRMRSKCALRLSDRPTSHPAQLREVWCRRAAPSCCRQLRKVSARSSSYSSSARPIGAAL
jgi:hypothetical protein